MADEVDIRDGDLVLVSRGTTYIAWVQRAGAESRLTALSAHVTSRMFFPLRTSVALFADPRSATAATRAEEAAICSRCDEPHEGRGTPARTPLAGGGT